jgi:uncharacterized protein YktA (UPF0223 family)
LLHIAQENFKLILTRYIINRGIIFRGLMNKRNKFASGKSNSEIYLDNKVDLPQVSALMAKSVSSYRRNVLNSEVEQGLFKDGSQTVKENGLTHNAVVSASVGLKKNAQVVSSSSYTGGAGDVVKQAPDIYSPLWLNSNISLPRDRATINAWCRSFYALNPFVHNAINLHSTYPISKLTIKCPNKDIEKFFNDMIEEIDLMNICIQIAQEYWLLGEAFVYAELDENKGKWSRLVIQNPDYMVVKRTVVANEPIIMLRPDENLKKIVNSNKPTDIEQRKQLNQHIIDSVKRGQNIQLPNFNVHHLARKISPYEIRGTGLPVCIFRQLMLMDKLRECYSEDTEVLTDKGFRKISDIVYKTSNIQINENYVNGVELDENNKISAILTMREDFKVACVNEQTNEIEYHKPTEFHMSKYSGEMINFLGKKVDILVSPNHKMWAKEQVNGKWKEYKKINASKMLEKKKYWKFRSKSKYISGNDIKSINIDNNEIPIELYLKVLGYIVSEGCIYENYKNNRYDSKICLSQLTKSDCYKDMRESFEMFAAKLNKKCCSYVKIKGSGYSKNTPKEKWEGYINSKELVSYIKNEIGTNGSTLSADKHLPRWILDLKPELLQIILNSLMLGDGTEYESKYGTKSKSYRYSTISHQLADDVYELVYKLGFVPNLCISNRKKSDGRIVKEYIVMWSSTNYGNEPLVCTSKKYSKNKGGGAIAKKVDYNGVVWCFEVPTGLFVTRRNGNISIQGNSKFAQADNMINPLTLVKIGTDGPDGLHPTYADIDAFREVFEMAQNDKDFKIFTHAGVAIERIGYGQGIYDISGDITQLIKEIFIGLQVPSVLMDGGADTTYANGGVALDVLRQRYMSFRNMLSSWLKNKIFAPISKIQGFYDIVDGEKKLIIPDIDWNHMSLFDAGDYISNLVQLTAGEGMQKRVSLHTLYRSLGLEFEDEVRKMRKELMQSIVFEKETLALKSMPLNKIRSLGEDDEINEPEPVPGQPAPGTTPEGESPPGGLPGLDFGGGGGAPPPPPPPPPPPK